MWIICKVRIAQVHTLDQVVFLNENGAWLPHPENHTDKVFDRLVDSTKQICKVAESEGMLLILEGGYVSPVYSAKRVKDF